MFSIEIGTVQVQFDCNISGDIRSILRLVHKNEQINIDGQSVSPVDVQLEIKILFYSDDLVLTEKIFRLTILVEFFSIHQRTLIIKEQEMLNKMIIIISYLFIMCIKD